MEVTLVGCDVRESALQLMIFPPTAIHCDIRKYSTVASYDNFSDSPYVADVG